MNELESFLEAVLRMRAAQRLEQAALPANFDRWRRVRAQQEVTRLEERVDALAKALSERGAPAPGS